MQKNFKNRLNQLLDETKDLNYKFTQKYVYY